MLVGVQEYHMDISRLHDNFVVRDIQIWFKAKTANDWQYLLSEKTILGKLELRNVSINIICVLLRLAFLEVSRHKYYTRYELLLIEEKGKLRIFLL